MKPRRTKSSSKSSSNYQLLLLSLLGLSTFCAQLLDASEYNVTAAAGKPGTCPANTETATASGNCTTECQSDTDCGGNEKCCPAGCGMSCRTPDEKPGSCPVSLTGISSLGFCSNFCQKDSECSKDMKCCINGCGYKSCAQPSA